MAYHPIMIFIMFIKWGGICIFTNLHFNKYYKDYYNVKISNL